MAPTGPRMPGPLPLRLLRMTRKLRPMPAPAAPPSAGTFDAQRLRRRIRVARGQEPGDLLLEGGLIVDIHPPTREMRLEILRRKAAAQSVELPDDVAALIADRSGPSVRQLEGGLTRVLAWAHLRDLPLDAATAAQVLAPVAPVPPPPVSLDAVLNGVSRHFGVTIEELKSHHRGRLLAMPRQLAMYLSRTMADASFPSISDKFGGRDHSTIIYAVRTVERRREAEPELKLLLGTLEREIRGEQA